MTTTSSVHIVKTLPLVAVRNSFLSLKLAIKLCCVYFVVRINNNNDNDDDDDDGSSSGGSSSGAVIGSVLAGLFIAMIVIFLVLCCVFIRYSYVRRNQSRAIIVTQRRTPRILIARVTRTVSSGPSPPPAYTPSAPNADYTPVSPRGYQPFPTTDCTAANSTNNPSVDNIPSDPPPEYTPAIPTNAPMPVSEGSAQ